MIHLFYKMIRKTPWDLVEYFKGIIHMRSIQVSQCLQKWENIFLAKNHSKSYILRLFYIFLIRLLLRIPLTNEKHVKIILKVGSGGRRKTAKDLLLLNFITNSKRHGSVTDKQRRGHPLMCCWNTHFYV